MRFLKRVGDALLILLILALALTIALSVYSKVTGNQVFQTTVLWVLTDSMEDAIPARSYILVKAVDPRELREGDIITFYSRDPAISGSLNSHRVVEIIGDHEAFRTKGDNNPAADAYTVPASDVVARYVRNLPALTVFGRLFATTGGLIVTFLLILVSCGAWLVLQFMGNARREKDAEIRRRIDEEVRRLQQNDEKKADDTP